MSLGLKELSHKRDVWNLVVDTADPNNFVVRSGSAEDAENKVEQDDGVQGAISDRI